MYFAFSRDRENKMRFPATRRGSSNLGRAIFNAISGRIIQIIRLAH